MNKNKDLYSPKLSNKTDKKMKLYIETSVPNFLFSTQDSVERQTITKNFLKISPHSTKLMYQIFIF